MNVIFQLKILKNHSNYNKEFSTITINRFCKYYIYLQMVFSQHINEILSVVFLYVGEGGVIKIIFCAINSIFFLITLLV